METLTLTLSSHVTVDRFASGKLRKFVIIPTDEEIAGLLERFDFVSVEQMSAKVSIRKVARDCWDVTGTLSAQVVQRCVISGDPVPEVVDFAIEERYVRKAESEDDIEVALDGAEPLVGDAIDIGEVVAQSLGLAVTPWPKSPSSDNSLVLEDTQVEHPFAGLAALKKPE